MYTCTVLIVQGYFIMSTHNNREGIVSIKLDGANKLSHQFAYLIKHDICMIPITEIECSLTTKNGVVELEIGDTWDAEIPTKSLDRRATIHEITLVENPRRDLTGDRLADLTHMIDQPRYLRNMLVDEGYPLNPTSDVYVRNPQILQKGKHYPKTIITLGRQYWFAEESKEQIEKLIKQQTRNFETFLASQTDENLSLSYHDSRNSNTPT
jgi:hypothetical protein